VIWDLNTGSNPDEFSVWREDEATNRGSGTYDTPQQDPYTFELSNGVPTIKFRGIETDARLDNFYFPLV